MRDLIASSDGGSIGASSFEGRESTEFDVNSIRLAGNFFRCGIVGRGAENRSELARRADGLPRHRAGTLGPFVAHRCIEGWLPSFCFRVETAASAGQAQMGLREDGKTRWNDGRAALRNSGSP